jgi:hypothetical protein
MEFRFRQVHDLLETSRVCLEEVAVVESGLYPEHAADMPAALSADVSATLSAAVAERSPLVRIPLKDITDTVAVGCTCEMCIDSLTVSMNRAID